MFYTKVFLVSLTVFLSFSAGKSASLTERLSHMIFPGTNWCGIGSIADNYDDLGPEKEIDSCCREHDMCPVEIESGTEKYGLYNKYFIARLHCNCDKNFYQCLKNATSSSISHLIGTIYFNILKYPCFAETCAENYVLPWGQCIGNKISRTYQWYNTELY